jgi:stage V sporulation protein S
MIRRSPLDGFLLFGVRKQNSDVVQVLQVASSSQPSSVAGAIAGILRERKLCEIQAIGAGAINQTVKAIAIARGYLAPAGMELMCVPSFADIEINGEERTAIRFKVEVKP